MSIHNVRVTHCICSWQNTIIN